MLNLEEGTKLRDEGMARVEAKTEQTKPGWGEQAYQHFLRYAAQAQQPFMTEDVVAYAEQNGLSVPHDKRAWGPVAARVVRSGIIACVGYKKQHTVSCHGSPKPLWKTVNVQQLQGH